MAKKNNKKSYTPKKNKKILKMAKESVKIKKKSKKREILISADPDKETEIIHKTKIRVIGIGGGAGNIISEISRGVKRADFFSANTDIQALKQLSKGCKPFPFGRAFTRELGCGMDADLGKKAAQGEKEKIDKLLKGVDLVILISSLGGGTGSGATPIFAKAAKELGVVTYGIFTLPFKFEGEKKMEIARESLREIKTHLNAISILPNERVFQIIDKNTSLTNALSLINKTLAEGLEGLIEVIYEPGLINIDFSDFRTILQNQGKLTYLNTIKVQKKGSSLNDLIEKVLNSPLYPYTIRGAKGVLFNIAGEKNISLTEISQISKIISDLAHEEAKIIFGVSGSGKSSDTLEITLLANGCSGKIFPSETKDKKNDDNKNLNTKKKTETIETAKVKKKKRRAPKMKKVKKSEIQLKNNQPKKTTVEEAFSGKPRAADAEKKTPDKNKHNEKVKEKTSPKDDSKAAEAAGEPNPESQSLPEEKESAAPVKEMNKVEVKIRKNALQVKKEAEEVEKELLEKEKVWETPAFLRKKFIKGQ